ncbi:MAG: FAD-dependent pyridine nucleotide-disulfide oxidoreductase [Parcubacteria group bacterium GW2011_GWA1_36_12]|nr:MAG: FAD-dependent pyridine nucleotide-disulfide oxidoreductase [Parcubacteria group bacterium GW2011_GWA1_36_12]
MLDLIIVGGSAAATTAGIYAARRGLNFKIITKDFGGEMATSGEIGNWPGITQIDGMELASQFKNHLNSYGVIPEEGVEVEKIIKQEDGLFCVVAHKDNDLCDYLAKTVIVATGVHPRELNVEGEKEFRGKGVSYCTVCDGPLFAGKTTAVIGGGNSALEAGLMLADISTKVYIINKNDQFKGDSILLDKLVSKKNVEIVYNAKTTKIAGKQFVDSLKYEKDGEHEITVDGIFIHIGMIPNSNIVPVEVQKNGVGEIIVGKNCETNIPGLYAAGDVTDVSFNQIVIAAGQGCVALLSAVQYLNKLK